MKRLLTVERVPAGSPMARFVGVAAYEAAGGPALRDLFADEYEHGVWLEDPALLIELAMKKLQAAADELSTRWKWAEPVADVDWSATSPMRRRTGISRRGSLCASEVRGPRKTAWQVLPARGEWRISGFSASRDLRTRIAGLAALPGAWATMD